MDIHEAVKLLDMSWREVIDESSIKQAWKKKVRYAHPDKNSQQNATRITQKLNEAKDTLLDNLDDIHRMQRGTSYFDADIQSWIHALEMQILACERNIRERRERMREMERKANEKLNRRARESKEQAERMAREIKEQAERFARERKEQAERMARETKEQAERMARKKEQEERIAREKKEREERELQQKQAEAKEERACARRADLEARLKAEKEKKRLRDEAGGNEPKSKPKQRKRRIPEETRAHRTTEGYKQAKDLVKEIQKFVSSDTFVAAPGNRLFVKDLMELFIQNRLNSDSVAMTTLETHLFQRHCKRLFLAAWPTAVYWMYENKRCFLHVQAKPNH